MRGGGAIFFFFINQFAFDFYRIQILRFEGFQKIQISVYSVWTKINFCLQSTKIRWFTKINSLLSFTLSISLDVKKLTDLKPFKLQQDVPKNELFSSKNSKNLQLPGAPDPDPGDSGGPQTPGDSCGRGLCPQTLVCFLRPWVKLPDPWISPLYCKFLAKRLNTPLGRNLKS